MEANTTLLIWFVGLTGFAVLLQAAVLLGILITLRKTAQAVDVVTKEVKTTVVPVINTTKELLEKISPQIQTVSAGIADLTVLVQKETSSARSTVSDITSRVHTQAGRIDHMLTTALNTVERAAETIENSVATPVRHANGVVAALKAVIGTYRSTPGTASSRPFTSRRSAVPGSPLRYPVPDPDKDVVL